MWIKIKIKIKIKRATLWEYLLNNKKPKNRTVKNSLGVVWSINNFEKIHTHRNGIFSLKC